MGQQGQACIAGVLDGTEICKFMDVVPGAAPGPRCSVPQYDPPPLPAPTTVRSLTYPPPPPCPANNKVLKNTARRGVLVGHGVRYSINAVPKPGPQ